MEPIALANEFFADGLGLLDEEFQVKEPLRLVPNNTLKNIARIGAIRATMFAKKEIDLYTPIACRQLRRDFNICSAKMYVYALDRKYKKEIDAALDRFQFAIGLLEMDTIAWQDLPNKLAVRKFDILLVSPQSAKMMRYLQTVDRCMISLYAAFFAGEIDRTTRDTILRPFHMAYLDFKNVAMKQTLTKNAQEMVDEMESE